MNRKTLSFILLAVVLAAICVRLGFWQLQRRDERRAHNRVVAARLALPPANIAEALHDTATQRFRRVVVQGRYDYEHELVLAARTNNGSPGVNLLTPLRLAGSDTAVLVNRGWVYSPDGSTVDLARWHEPDSASVDGYVESYATASAGPVTSPSNPRTVHRMLHDSIAAKLPYPLARGYVVARQASDRPRDSIPVRLQPPALDDGPHLSYAIQWFSFALIAIVGAGAVAMRERRGTVRG